MTPQLQAAAFQIAVYVIGPALLAAGGYLATLWRRIDRDHVRIRESFDCHRRLAYQVQLMDPSNEEVRAIRSKATRNADEMWREEGNVPRRVFVDDEDELRKKEKEAKQA